MIYNIKPICYNRIRSFYHNVAKKYKHTYSASLMRQNINDAISGMYGIEKCLLRRKPTIARWSNFWMAKSGKWFYAYTLTKDIQGNDVVTVFDACHGQNMHEQILRAHIKQLLENISAVSANNEPVSLLNKRKFRNMLSNCVAGYLRDIAML